MALDEVDGLVHSQVLLQLVHVDQLADLVLLHLVLVGDPLDLGVDVLLGCLDLLGVGHGLQGQADLDLLFGLRHEGSTELLHGLAHILQVVLEGQALLLHTEGKVVDQLIHPHVVHGLGDLRLHAADDLIHQGVLDRQVVLLVQLLLVGLADGLLELLQGVVLGAVLGQLVVQSGQLLVLDLVQLDLEDSGLAGQLIGLILLGEGDVDVELLAGAVTHDLILEAGDEAAAAQGQVVVLGLAALKGHPVGEALEVDVHDVAVFSGTLAGQLTGVALLHTLELGVHSGLLNSMDGFLHGQTVVSAQLDFGLDGHLDGQDGALVIAGGLHGHLRTAHRLDAGLLDGGLEGSREQVVDGVVGEHIGAVHPLDQVTGGLALAEALDGVLLALGLKDLQDLVLIGLGVDRELQLRHALFELFTLDEIHFVFLRSNIGAGAEESSPRICAARPSTSQRAHAPLGTTIASAFIITRSVHKCQLFFHILGF